MGKVHFKNGNVEKISKSFNKKRYGENERIIGYQHNVSKEDHLTLFLLGGGVNLTPPVVFFYITQKVLVWGC